MPKEEITEWLGSPDPDWSRGLSLLVSCSPNRHLIRLLTKRGRTPKTVRLLTYELSRLANVKPSAQVGVTKPAVNPSNRIRPVKAHRKIRHSQVDLNATGEQAGDPYLISLITKKNQAYKEYAYLRDVILYQTISVRHKQAARIIQLKTIIDDFWDQIEYYKKYHAPFPVDSRLGLLDMDKNILNLRTYVSRYKRYAADPARNAGSREKYQRMHDEYLLQLNILEAKIRTDGAV